MASGGISTTGAMNTKLLEHLDVYINFLTEISEYDSGYKATDIRIDISDINIAEALIKLLNLDRKEIGRHTQDDNFVFFKYSEVDLPTYIFDLAELDTKRLSKYGILKHVRSLQKFSTILMSLRNKYPNVSFGFDLARIAGIGYYNGPCFKISASNPEGIRFPLADGGYSDWLARLLSNRRVKYFSSGFGLELFGKLFKVSSNL